MFTKRRNVFIVFTAIIAVFGMGGSALGFVTTASYGFTAITNNSATNVAIGENQFGLEMTDVGTLLVGLSFTNAGPEASSITDIYFDDGSGFLDDFVAISSPTPGSVAFTEGARPRNLPAGRSLRPKFIADFSLDSDPPVMHNGVNPSEQVDVVMFYSGTPGFSEEGFGHIVDAINRGDLRIGIHAQGFANGGSESYIISAGGDVNVVPAPGAGLLTIIGLSLVGKFKRRFA